jgi:dCMP deaminase
MAQVDLAAMQSTCRTRHVGGVLVKGNRIVAQGFNGNLPGHAHCDRGGCPRCADRAEGRGESGESLGACLCVHAEQNIVSYCARNGIAMDDTTVYLPCNPCLDCMKLVVSSGVSEIVFRERYPSTFLAVHSIAEVSGVIMRLAACECPTTNELRLP